MNNKNFSMPMLKTVNMVKFKRNYMYPINDNADYIFGEGFWYNANGDGKYLYVRSIDNNICLMFNYYDVEKYIGDFKYA
jgi:hypothetical protein